EIVIRKVVSLFPSLRRRDLIIHGAALCGYALPRTRTAEPQPQDRERHKRSGGVKQRIVGRSRAAGDERLMDLIESGVASCDKQRSQAPKPSPTPPRSAHRPKQQHAENKAFGKMGALPDEVMN